MNDSVYITKFSTFFPNEPVGNDEMEDYIGLVNKKSLLAKRIILERNGIKRRYYALDKSGKATHTNAQIAANAVRGLFDDTFNAEQMDLLACGTASPEQLMPSHGVMVHGELGVGDHTEVETFSGSCCTGVQALKYAYLSMLTGTAKHAVCVASERASAWMTSRFLKNDSSLFDQLTGNPILSFEKEFLRWMLSDGSVAVLLDNKPSGKHFSYRIEWVDIKSFAHQVEVCMYAGGEKQGSKMVGYTEFSEDECMSKSLLALKQDTRVLERYIVKLGGQFLEEIVAKRHFNPDEIDWFLPHLSSMYFESKIEEEIQRLGYNIPKEKWFINLPETGNIASASAFAMLEELNRSGRLKKGDKILVMVPESARFTYAYVLLTVV